MSKKHKGIIAPLAEGPGSLDTPEGITPVPVEPSFTKAPDMYLELLRRLQHVNNAQHINRAQQLYPVASRIDENTILVVHVPWYQMEAAALLTSLENPWRTSQQVFTLESFSAFIEAEERKLNEPR